MDTGDVRFDYGLTVDVEMIARGMLDMVRLDSDKVALKAGMLPARLMQIMRAQAFLALFEKLRSLPEEEVRRLTSLLSDRLEETMKRKATIRKTRKVRAQRRKPVRLQRSVRRPDRELELYEMRRYMI